MKNIKLYRNIFIIISLISITLLLIFCITNLRCRVVTTKRDNEVVATLKEGLLQKRSDLKFVNIPEGTTVIKERSFKDCTNLAEVLLPDSLKTIEAEAFSSCKSLSSIIIPDNVKEIGLNAFKRCSYLSTVVLSDSSKGLRTIDDFAFSDCNIRKFILPESVRFLGKNVLQNNPINEIRVPYAMMDQNIPTRLGIKDTDALEIYFGPASVASIESSVVEVDYIPYEIAQCSIKGNKYYIFVDEGYAALKEGITGSIPNSIIYNNARYPVKRIMANAFKGVDFTKVYLPKNLEIIEDGAFLNCKSIEKIKIPASVIKIGNSAFKNCNNIEKLDIPYGIKTIEKDAFWNVQEVILPDGGFNIQEYALRGVQKVSLPSDINLNVDIDYFGFSSSDFMLKKVEVGPGNTLRTNNYIAAFNIKYNKDYRVIVKEQS